MLTGLVTHWAVYYADHKAVSIAVTYLHVAAVFVGGGAAITLDAAVLRARRAGHEARTRVLETLASSHRTVVPALVVVCTTGLLLLASDRETFLALPLFYAKMAMVAALLLNGSLLLLAERRATTRGDAGWRLLTVVSGASLFLWLAILLAGTWLPVAG